jgi:exodeoxyribonuclease III
VTFRLLSYNIRRGGLGREEALASVVSASEPDLVLLQEATDPSAVERVARAAGLAHWVSRPKLSVAFLSRRPVKAYRWTRPRWARHAFVEVTLDSGASIIGVHLSAVHSNWTERRRLVELRALLAHIHAGHPGFHVLTGDFNTLAAGEELDVSRLPSRLRVVTWLTGRRIRWLTIRRLVESGYTDAFRALHLDEAGHTFPTWDPHLRLDYTFVPTGFSDRVRACEVVNHPDAKTASDHLPLLTDLVI